MPPLLLTCFIILFIILLYGGIGYRGTYGYPAFVPAVLLLIILLILYLTGAFHA